MNCYQTISYLRMKPIIAVICLCIWGSVLTSAWGAPPTRDIVFAEIDSHKLKLNLYLPKDKIKPPLVIFIHGGGWKSGSYKKCSTAWLTDYGFTVASIGYRLTDKAVFPAQIHDCKAAVRWLRKHADEYGYNAERIGVTGTSAGGYLSLFLGVTGGVAEFEGTIGGNLEQSSQVQAIVDYFGPSDFVLRSKNHSVKTEKPKSPVWGLLGKSASSDLPLAQQASPAYHVTKNDPPLLIIHGDKDKTVFLEQSKRMVEEYRKDDLNVTMEIVAGGGHGGKPFFTPVYRDKVVRFLNKHLRPAHLDLKGTENDGAKQPPTQPKLK